MIHQFSRYLIVIIIIIIFLFTVSYNLYSYLKVSAFKTKAMQLDTNNSYQAINFFTEITSIVKHSYYKDISLSTLINYAIAGMLHHLDSYSYVLSSKEMNNLQTELQNKFIGLGLQIVKLHAVTEVIAVLPNSPAELAGIIRGDLITHINNIATQALSLEQISKSLQGVAGSSIQLKLLRYPNTKLDTTLVRKHIKVNTNPLLVRINKQILYLKINIFSQNTDKRLLSVITNAQNNHQLKAIILDLRNNPGGLLEQAIKVTDLFINNGILLFIYSKNNKINQAFTSKHQDIIPNLPIVVLINHNSASAAEIVSGSLQAHQRATIIGTRSFGKGSLQTIIPLSDKRSLKLTTGVYILPNGKSVNKQGITPDITVFANGNHCVTCNDFQINKFTSKEIEYLSKQPDKMLDYQLEYAYKLLTQK